MLLNSEIHNEMLLRLTGGIPVRTALFNFENNFYAALLNAPDMSKVIIIPSNWEEMDQPTLEFVMAHETGHHALGHVTNVEPVGSDLDKAREGLFREFEADEYAASVVGRKQAIDGLKGTMKWFEKHGLFLNKIELNGTLVIRMVALVFPYTKWKKTVLTVAFLGAR